MRHQFRSLDEVQSELQKYYALSHTRMGDDSAIARMRPLLAALGNPQNRLKVIHVAGTSGKTSTCYYIAALLSASGKKVGLTVSPYIETILERVQIDGKLISEDDFCRSMSEFLEIVESLEQKPGYFEVLIGFSLWYFDTASVDYVVLETGIGGMFDSTNVVERSDKICVITDIGLDHMHVLGESVEEIAWQKAGIIQNQNHVFMHVQRTSIMRIIEQRIFNQGAFEHFFSDSNADALSDTPLYQQRNWHLAREVADFVSKRDGFLMNAKLLPHDIVVPGRMEKREQSDGSLLILDGAHNAQKMTAFVESFKAMYPDQKAAILVAFKKDKEYRKAVKLLAPITTRLIVTYLDGQKSAGKIVTASPEEIAEFAQDLGFNVDTETTVALAFQRLLSTSAPLKVVTGSLYLVGAVKTILKEEHEAH